MRRASKLPPNSNDRAELSRKVLSEQQSSSEKRKTRRICTPAFLACGIVLLSVASLVVMLLSSAGAFKVHHGPVLVAETHSSSAGLASKGGDDSSLRAKQPKSDVPVPMISKNNRQYNNNTGLPKWVTDYMKWHRSMRAKYPNEQLITDPDAPKLLVRVCNGRCGGLHDRLGQLPLDLYVAHQSNRLLLIEWQFPHALEEFLVPPDESDANTDEYIDWTYPGQLIDKKKKREWSDIVNAGKMRQKDEVDDFDAFIGNSIDRLNTGDLKDKRNVTYTVVHEYRKDPLAERFKALDENDAIYGTASYGRIFNAFFKPSPKLQEMLDQLYKDLNLVPREYSTVHCRVRHPFAYNRGSKIESGKYVANSDYQNFDFEGVFKESSVSIATHALKCAISKGFHQEESIYFMSDYSLLVNYMTQDFSKVELETANDNRYESEAAKVASAARVVSRPISGITYHIDKQNARGVDAYYGTFLDLYLAINARCLALGIGNYAAFASEISGTDCVIRYSREKWGLGVTRKDNNFICQQFKSIFDEGFN